MAERGRGRGRQMNGAAAVLKKSWPPGPGKAPLMTLCHGIATELFRSDGTSLSVPVREGAAEEKT